MSFSSYLQPGKVNLSQEGLQHHSEVDMCVVAPRVNQLSHGTLDRKIKTEEWVWMIVWLFSSPRWTSSHSANRNPKE